MTTSISNRDFPVLLERFFCDYLLRQREVSRQTVASYRDTFRLLFRFLRQHLRREPASLALADLDAPHVLAFLDHLENERGNSARSRNTRLAAVRSFMKYAAFQDPPSLPLIQRVLSIPLKRFDRPSVDYLSLEEVNAVLDSPDASTWSGHRDRVLLRTLYNTGARVSEIIGANVSDFQSGGTATLRIRGKGRKERVVPLWKETKRRICSWLPRIDRGGDKPLFPNRRGERLSRSGVRSRLAAAASSAAERCRSLDRHSISPHLLRHTTAMHLLQSGVDITVIAVWLGHESTSTTHMYIEADLEMKKRAIQKAATPTTGRDTYRPDDRLLAFLDSL